jgi:4-hydroxybenzoate polyprenyltransferase
VTTGAQRTPWLFVASLRPEQWTKNLCVFAGLLFGGRLTAGGQYLGAACATFAIFCGLSGTVYLFNDLADRDADAQHPLKRLRPIPSGQLSSSVALVGGLLLALGCLTGAFLLSPRVGIVGAAYLGLLTLYSLWLKHLVIIDALTIAGGFVLRAVAGAVAVSVSVSPWLLVCITLLALFLAFSKRRHELTLLGQAAGGHRPILQAYSPYLLDQMISVVTSSTVTAYAVYTTSSDTAARVGSGNLALTIPFVLYGIFRYLYLVHQERGGGSPTAMLLSDRGLLLCVGLWSMAVGLILYRPWG